MPLRAAMLVLLALLAVAAPASASPWSYLAHPTDQLGVPGELAGVEVTPEGGLYTGWAETTFRFGPKLTTWRAPVRTAAEDRWPVLTSTRRIDGIEYALTLFCDVVDGRVVAFARATMRNAGHRARVARFAAGVRDTGGALKADGITRRFRFPRPATPSAPGYYAQPGATFRPDWSYAFTGDAVTRDGAVLLTVPPGSARRLRPDGPGAVTPATVFGLAGVDPLLAPGERAVADFRMPVEPVAATDPAAAAIARSDFEAHRQGVVAAWKARLKPAMTVDVPEAKVADAFTTSLVDILVARYRDGAGRWVQAVNKLRYQAFWLRDAAMMTDALDLAGLFTPAGENLPFFARFQQDDGLFISRAGQYDGVGEALWAISEHVLRSGDDAMGRAWLPRLDAAAGWIARERAKDPLGLLPAGDPKDDELVAGHLPGDDFWAVAGLDAATRLAKRLGEGTRAATWGREHDALKARLVALAGTRAIPPAFDAPGGQDWGNLWAAWPAATLPAGAPAVTRTLDAARGRFAEGIATWGATHGLHGYLGFRVFETELLRGEQARVVAGLYASLAHTTSTHGGFETGVRAYGRRAVDDNLAPHGWFAAEYVTLLRNMLVRDLDGGGAEIGSALAPGWLAPGRRVGVARAPLAAGGTISWSLRSDARGATLHWSTTAPAGTPLRLRIPAAVTHVRAIGLRAGARTLTLPGRAGRLRVSWTAPVVRTSFARSARHLAAAYRARGVTPPG